MSPSAGPADLPAPGLAYVFSIELLFGVRHRTPDMLSGVSHSWVGVEGGTVFGPCLNGRVLPGGGDPAKFRDDGFVELDAKYILRADDGTDIFVNNRGLRNGAAQQAAGVEPGIVLDPRFFDLRTTPVFDTGPGPHAWLTQNTFVGIGRRREDGAGNLIHYFRLEI